MSVPSDVIHNQFWCLRLAIRKRQWSIKQQALWGKWVTQNSEKRHCTFDPGSSFDWMAFLHLVPSRCRPLIADTWLTGPAHGHGGLLLLNNGRLRHNHPQWEDSLWPPHPSLSLSLLIRKSLREMKRKTETKGARRKKGMRRKDTANYSEPIGQRRKK